MQKERLVLERAMDWEGNNGGVGPGGFWQVL
jgi:hypothetical protein